MKSSYFRYFRKYRWKIVIALILSTLNTVGHFVTTYITSICADEISNPNLWCFLLALLGFGIGTQIVSFFESKVILGVKIKVIQDIRWKLLSTTSRARVELVRKTKPIELEEISIEDPQLYVDAVCQMYKEIFNVLLGLLALIYTGYNSWQLLIFLIFSFAIILTVQFFSVKRMVKSQSETRKTSVSAKTFLIQVFQSFSDMKVQKLTIKPYISNTLEKEMNSKVNFQKITLTNNLISESLSTVMQVIFIFIASILVLRSQLSRGIFISIYLYKGHIYGLVSCILKLVRYKAQSKASILRMNELCDTIAIVENWGPIHLSPCYGNIEINNLTVYYNNAPVLNNLSLSIAPGFTAIIGASGCGKSTLLDVLSKKISNYSGQIFLDGIELSQLDERSYRKAIVLAPQKPFWFELSVRENLLLAKPNASDNELWYCLKQCAAAEFIIEKGGLDSILNPETLSGGQIQRLALARIALRGGQVILMDEATSALDPESQQIVIDSIEKAAQMGHTMVLVAHRVSALKNADKIVIIEDGQVYATGTYHELYKTCPKFRRMADLS